MPSAVREVMGAAGLEPAGVVSWLDPVPDRSPGVYVVSLSSDPGTTKGGLIRCPLDPGTLEAWLAVRPQLTVDGGRPTVEELSGRLAAFWLPDEVILYIGKAGTSLRHRVDQYYRTPLGARRPHAGGHWLKTLSVLQDLHVYWAPTDEPEPAEDELLRRFCAGVSHRTRGILRDPDHPFPFANLEWPAGTRKQHGIKGATGDTPNAPSRR
jgi:hypothetical protein